MTSQAEPPVTVLVPVRNGATWLPGMLDSILTQSYPNFEILLVDDASTDHSADVARSIAQSRLRVIKAQGEGLAAALNLGVVSADTDLICRMDVDDLALPQRLATQVRFMVSNPDYALVGSNVQLINMADKVVGRTRLPETDADIRLRMLIGNPFAHSSVMFRQASVIGVGNYWSPDHRPFPEDYHLWTRLAHVGLMANLRDELVQYRINESGVFQQSQELMRTRACEIALSWKASLNRHPLSRREVEAWQTFAGTSDSIRLRDAGLVTRVMIRERILQGRVFSKGFRLRHYLKPFTRVFGLKG